MKDIIKKFLETGSLDFNSAVQLINYYSDNIAKAKFPIEYLQQLAPMIDWNVVVSKVALHENLVIYKIFDKNGGLIKQYLQE